MQKGKKISVGIFGHYGNENLGDEAIICAVIQHLRKRRENIQLYGLSINPADTEKRHGVPSYPIRRLINRSVAALQSNAKPSTKNETATNKPNSSVEQKTSFKARLKQLPVIGYFFTALALTLDLVSIFVKELLFLKESYSVVKKLDLLMITGSNQFLDNFGGTMGFPYTLLKWSVLARIAGKKVAIVSVGAGPIYNRSSKYLFLLVLKLADYISFRDVASQELVQSFGFKGESVICPDLAHSLIIDLKQNDYFGVCEKPVVGINPMPVYDSRYWYKTDSSEYTAYVNKLAGFSAWLIQNNYPLFFYATQPKDENVARDVVDELNKLNKGMGNQAQVRVSRDICVFFQNLEDADIVVTTRFHGALLGLFAEKAVLGICYYRKADDLLKEYGQGDYSMVLEDMTADEMSDKFLKLERNMAQIKSDICAKNKVYNDALGEQYDKIIAFAEC